MRRISVNYYNIMDCGCLIYHLPPVCGLGQHQLLVILWPWQYSSSSLPVAEESGPPVYMALHDLIIEWKTEGCILY